MAETFENGMSEAQEARRFIHERFGASGTVIGTPEINRAIHNRDRWERALGADLGDVRVHHHSRHHHHGRELGAEAFTRGQDIFFAPGHRAGGDNLLGHELAHVIQQRQGRP